MHVLLWYISLIQSIAHITIQIKEVQIILDRADLIQSCKNTGPLFTKRADVLL